MTDLEKYIELYRGFGVDLSFEKSENKLSKGGFIIQMEGHMHAIDGDVMIYGGGGCDIHFNADGKFLGQYFFEYNDDYKEELKSGKHD